MIEFAHEVLLDSPLVRVIDITWRADDGRPTPEYPSPMPEITLMRRGLFVKNHGRSKVVCDPNTLAFINHHEAYSMTHPVQGKCACTALHVQPEFLSQVLSMFERSAEQRRRDSFTFDACPCDPVVSVDHYKLLARIRANERDELAVEEAAVVFVRQLIGSALRFHGRKAPRVRLGTQRAHQELAESVKQLLGARYQDQLTLSEIADDVNCAPNHLCWVFRSQTGLPIHRYLRRLRLVAGLDRLADSKPNIAHLAVELGFAHHSHFSTAFRTEFGLQPSRIRGTLSPKSICKIRKNLKV